MVCIGLLVPPLIGDSITTGSPFSSRGHPSSPRTMKSAFFPNGTTAQFQLADQAIIFQVRTKPSRELQVYSHATTAVSGCHHQFSCHESQECPYTNVLVPGQGMQGVVVARGGLWHVHAVLRHVDEGKQPPFASCVGHLKRSRTLASLVRAGT